MIKQISGNDETMAMNDLKERHELLEKQ